MTTIRRCCRSGFKGLSELWVQGEDACLHSIYEKALIDMHGYMIIPRERYSWGFLLLEKGTKKVHNGDRREHRI
jgi:hypothetical protein